jgi:hypothetical protein
VGSASRLEGRSASRSWSDEEQRIDLLFIVEGILRYERDIFAILLRKNARALAKRARNSNTLSCPSDPTDPSIMTKLTIPSIVALACILAGCEKPSRVSQETPADAPAESTEASSTPAPKPKRDARAVTSKADPAQAETAPPTVAQEPEPPKKIGVNSVVFASQRIGVTNDDGIFGVPAGSQLRVVAIKENGFRVSDGMREFDVNEGQVAMSTAAASGAAHLENAQRMANAAWHREQLGAAQQQREEAARQATATANERKSRETAARLDALRREEAQLMASIATAREQNEAAFYARANGRAYTKAFSTQHLAAWESRLAATRVERERIERELLSSR